MRRFVKEIDVQDLIHKYVDENLTLKDLEKRFHAGHKRLSQILSENNIEITPGYKAQNIEGKKYGKLTAIEVVGERKYKKGKDRLWRCVCDCGNEVIVTQSCLLRGTSCGCERKKKIAISLTTHGGTRTKLYNVWLAMRRRCGYKKEKSYKNYGGRGIKVCDEWMNDFSAFRSWSEEHGYKEGLTIERIDNNGDYEPSNCRWATVWEQSHNKRNNNNVIYNGKQYTVSELGRLVGVDRRTIADRLKRGWSVEESISIRKTTKATNNHEGNI